MKECYLCKSTERDEIKYGEFMTRGKVSVHYFCLLLTSNLMQRGKDNDGFLGFLTVDIKSEANRVNPVVCCYCKKKSANISCCASKCRRTFHLICGIENEAENQFVGTFKSFCDRHSSGKKVRRPPPNETCCICYEVIIGQHGHFSSVNLLRAPCCKNGWFHKWCLAAFAKSAGYFFKCPLCNDNKVFRQQLVTKGIFIPDRDASWELEPNAYAELLERPNQCVAMICKAKGARASKTTKSNENELLYCGTCGSVAIHRGCMTEPVDNFFCDECVSVVAAVNSSSIINISASQPHDEDEDVDVCDDDEAAGNSLRRYSESDDDCARPLGRANGSRILDDAEDEGTEQLPNVDDESDDEIIIRPSRPKKNRLPLVDFVDTTEEVDAKRKRAISRDTESLFDSGAETDRSASSGDKFSSKNSLHSSPLQVKSENKRVNVNQCETLHKSNRSIRRYTSLNDTASSSMCVAKRTRRQSMNADMCFNIKDYTKASVTSLSKLSSTETLSEASSKFDRHKAAAVTPQNPRRSIRTLERTLSEDPSTSPPALERTRRKSFLKSPYCNLQQQTSRSPSFGDNPSPAIFKRTRSDSIPDNLISESKRLKEKNSNYENENYCEVVTSTCKRRPSRGRSPLSSNGYRLYAFITPSYVKNTHEGNEGNSFELDAVSPNGSGEHKFESELHSNSIRSGITRLELLEFLMSKGCAAESNTLYAKMLLFEYVASRVAFISDNLLLYKIDQFCQELKRRWKNGNVKQLKRYNHWINEEIMVSQEDIAHGTKALDKRLYECYTNRVRDKAVNSTGNL